MTTWNRRTFLAAVAAVACVLSPHIGNARDKQQKKAPPPIGFTERSFDFGGYPRRYILHLPANLDTKKPAPLILMLHGGGSSADKTARIMDIQAKAAKQGIVVAYPEGLWGGFNAGPGPDGKSPNFGRAVKEGIDDVGYISKVLDDIAAQTSIDPRRVYATGWSNGSAMSFRLAVELSDRIAAVACAFSELSLKHPLKLPAKHRPVPTMYFWGTADPIKRPGSPPKAEMTAWLMKSLITLNQCDPDPKEVIQRGKAQRTTWTGKDPRSRLIEWKLEGSGHWWPGLDVRPARVPQIEKTFGPLQHDISATDEAIAFFLANPMPAKGAAPPGPNGLGAGDHTRLLTVGDLKRSYLVHVPKSYDGTKPFPVVLAFHGGGGNPEGMVKFCGLNKTADKHGFIVVYPSGTGQMEKRLTFNGGNCCGYAMTNKIDDVSFTKALLDDLAKVVKVDAKRVYATGMSNGAIMSYRLASELSDRIAAIAPVSGLMGTEKCAPKRPVPVIHFHGTDDQFAPFKGGDSKIVLSVKNLYSVDHGIKAWIKANGCKEEPTTIEIPDNTKDGTRATRMTYGGGKDGAEVILIAIEGMGHAWPGQPGVKVLGKSTKNISANEEMWKFFEKHAMK